MRTLKIFPNAAMYEVSGTGNVFAIPGAASDPTSVGRLTPVGSSIYTESEIHYDGKVLKGQVISFIDKVLTVKFSGGEIVRLVSKNLLFSTKTYLRVLKNTGDESVTTLNIPRVTWKPLYSIFLSNNADIVTRSPTVTLITHAIILSSHHDIDVDKIVISLRSVPRRMSVTPYMRGATALSSSEAVPSSFPVTDSVNLDEEYTIEQRNTTNLSTISSVQLTTEQMIADHILMLYINNRSDDPEVYKAYMLKSPLNPINGDVRVYKNGKLMTVSGTEIYHPYLLIPIERENRVRSLINHVTKRQEDSRELEHDIEVTFDVSGVMNDEVRMLPKILMLFKYRGIDGMIVVLKKLETFLIELTTKEPATLLAKLVGEDVGNGMGVRERADRVTVFSEVDS